MNAPDLSGKWIPIWSGSTSTHRPIVLVARGYRKNPDLAVWPRDVGGSKPLWFGTAADFEEVVIHGETVISGWGGAALLAACRAVSDFVAEVWEPSEHLHSSGWVVTPDGMAARFGEWEIAREGSDVRILGAAGTSHVAVPRAVVARLARDRRATNAHE